MWVTHLFSAHTAPKTFTWSPMQDMLAIGGRYGRAELCVFPDLVFPHKWVSLQTYILPFTGKYTVA